MIAIRVNEFGGPEVLSLEETEIPRPQAGEVVVRVETAGVNPYDTYMRAGAYGARNPPLPFTPGSNSAGYSRVDWTRYYGSLCWRSGVYYGNYQRCLCRVRIMHSRSGACIASLGKLCAGCMYLGALRDVISSVIPNS